MLLPRGDLAEAHALRLTDPATGTPRGQSLALRAHLRADLDHPGAGDHPAPDERAPAGAGPPPGEAVLAVAALGGADVRGAGGVVVGQLRAARRDDLELLLPPVRAAEPRLALPGGRVHAPRHRE